IAAGADRLILLCSNQRLLVLARRCRLRGSDEARADDRSLRAERERRDDAAAVDDAPRGNDRDLDRVDDLGDERERADLARRPTPPGSPPRQPGPPPPPRRGARVRPCRSSP